MAKTIIKQEAPGLDGLRDIFQQEKAQAEARYQQHLEAIHHDVRRIDPRQGWTVGSVYRVIERETPYTFTGNGLLNRREEKEYQAPRWLWDIFDAAPPSGNKLSDEQMGEE